MAETPTARARSLRLFLPGWDLRLDAANETRGQHWSRRSRRAKAAREHVFVALHRRDGPRAPFLFDTRAEVRVTCFMGPRRRALDPDNASSACKPLLDALVRNGVLRGDTEKHVDLRPVRFVPASERQPGEAEGVEITVLETPPEPQ